MFATGLVVFTAASVLCGVATSRGLLVAARALQGVGGAMTSAVVLGMLVALFPQPREQARAIAVFSAVGAAGGALGTFLGGALTQTVGWHWIFLINLPIGVVAWLAAIRILAPDRGVGLGKGADYPGAALVTGALMLTVYTIVGAGDRSLGVTLASAALALGLYVGFVLRQARAARPLLRLRLFRSRALSGANGVQILMVAGMFGFQYIGALYLQRVLGYSELTTGTAFLPAPIAIGVLMLTLSARTIARFGPYRVLLAGLVLITGGMALLSRAPADSSYVADVLPHDAAARRRIRGRDARGDGARHDGRPGGGRGTGLRALQHHAGGGRFTGTGRADDAGGESYGASDRRGRGDRRSPGGRLPAGVHGGHGDRADGLGPGGGDPAAGAGTGPARLLGPARASDVAPFPSRPVLTRTARPAAAPGAPGSRGGNVNSVSLGGCTPSGISGRKLS